MSHKIHFSATNSYLGIWKMLQFCEFDWPRGAWREPNSVEALSRMADSVGSVGSTGSSKRKRSNHQWSNEETKLFLKLMKGKYGELGFFDRTKRKKVSRVKALSEIADGMVRHGFEMTGTTVDKKRESLLSSLTLCETTARSTKLRKKQSYKSVFYLKNEALLLITTLPCLNAFVSLIMKNKSKSSWHTEKFAKSRLKEKSSGRMRTKRRNRKECCFLHFFSSSPGPWQTSKLPQEGRVLSDRKIDLQTTLLSRSQLESSAGKPFTSSWANQTPRQELRTTPLKGARMEGSATSEGQNDNFFYRTKNEGLFKASTWSLVIQLHAREKWRRWGNHNYQKIRLECTQVAIDRNRSMASQRVKTGRGPQRADGHWPYARRPVSSRNCRYFRRKSLDQTAGRGFQLVCRQRQCKYRGWLGVLFFFGGYTTPTCLVQRQNSGRRRRGRTVSEGRAADWSRVEIVTARARAG